MPSRPLIRSWPHFGAITFAVGLLISTCSAQEKPSTKHKAGQSGRLQTEVMPCPRAQWKDDPVCSDAPDEHTLPMPHLNRPSVAQPETPSMKLGAKWQASSRITEPTPHLVDRPGDDFNAKNTPPDTRGIMGVDFKF